MGDYMREIKEFHEPGGYFAPRKKKVMTNFEKWITDTKPDSFIYDDEITGTKYTVFKNCEKCPLENICEIEFSVLDCGEAFLKWAEGSVQE